LSLVSIVKSYEAFGIHSRLTSTPHLTKTMEFTCIRDTHVSKNQFQPSNKNFHQD